MKPNAFHDQVVIITGASAGIGRSLALLLARKHPLIKTGRYANIRHPLHTGLFGWCAVLSLLTASWIFLGTCVLSFVGLLWRISREEQMMIEAFGEEYKAYMQHTGRLFPKLVH